MKFYTLVITILLSLISSVQANVLERKGKWNFYYGYNRASYSNSDYHLTGNNYDFTLKNVAARDGQSEIEAKFLLPWNLSVPQNNTRFGYFLTDNLSVSFGNDHMKYIMRNNQTVDFEGTIATGEGFDQTGPGTRTLSGDFLQFEHTDGLNFISVELEHFITLWNNPKKTQALSFLYGPGLAIMYPKTNATLFGRGRHDKFHVAGTGYSVKIGLEYNFSEDYFARFMVKHGHINMPNVRTTSNPRDKLSHQFDFKETFIVFGVYF